MATDMAIITVTTMVTTMDMLPVMPEVDMIPITYIEDLMERRDVELRQDVEPPLKLGI